MFGTMLNQLQRSLVKWCYLNCGFKYKGFIAFSLRNYLIHTILWNTPGKINSLLFTTCSEYIVSLTTETTFPNIANTDIKHFNTAHYGQYMTRLVFYLTYISKKFNYIKTNFYESILRIHKHL